MEVEQNNQAEETPHITTAGERGIPQVGTTKKKPGKRSFRMVLLLILFLVSIGLLSYSIMKGKSSTSKGIDEEAPIQEAGTVVRERTLSFMDRQPEEEPAAEPVVPAIALNEPQPAAAGPVQPSPTTAQTGPKPAVYKLDKSASPLMVNMNAPRGEMNQRPMGQEAGTMGEPAQPISNLGTPRTASRIITKRANMLSDRNFLLTRGTIIDCSLKLKLVTDIAGETACTVSRDIYSNNGRVVLVERGSLVTGKFQPITDLGKKRILVIWDRIETPNGVTIQIDSPGTDPLGGSGVPGYVDNHFIDRFGAALLLSIVDIAGQAAINSLNSSSGTNINFGSATQSGRDMSAEVLKQTVNIPPTLYENQGARASIYITDDLDFSSVYELITY